MRTTGVTAIALLVLRTGELKTEKDGKNKSQYLGFLSHNILGLATLKVYKKFEDSGSHRNREIRNRKFDWRERKMDK